MASHPNFSFSCTLASSTGAFILLCFEEDTVGYHYIIPGRFEEYIFVIPFSIGYIVGIPFALLRVRYEEYIVGILFAVISTYLRRPHLLEYLYTTRSTSLHSAEESGWRAYYLVCDYAEELEEFLIDETATVRSRTPMRLTILVLSRSTLSASSSRLSLHCYAAFMRSCVPL